MKVTVFLVLRAIFNALFSASLIRFYKFLIKRKFRKHKSSRAWDHIAPGNVKMKFLANRN